MERSERSRRRITKLCSKLKYRKEEDFFRSLIGPSLNRLTWKFPNLCAFRFRASSNRSRCRAFKKISQRKPIRTTRVLRNARVNYAVQHVINDRSYRSPERRRTLTNSLPSKIDLVPNERKTRATNPPGYAQACPISPLVRNDMARPDEPLLSSPLPNPGKSPRV